MSTPPRGARIPFDWWKIYHTIMKAKDWTREQVGQLTLNDLRLLSFEVAPPEPGETLSTAGRIESLSDFEAVLAARREEENSWI